MIDINSRTFVQDFQIEKATVGIVGHGYVGQAVDAFFKPKCRTIVYDKAKPELATLIDVVKLSEVIFVCVPTPMRKDGSCFTGIVEEVLRQIVSLAKTPSSQRDLQSFIVVIKSTLPPGFLEEIQNTNELFGLRVVFSPEFLTEKASIQDFAQCNRFIFGGDQEDALIACKYFHGVDPGRFERERIQLFHCEPTVAEMVKLFTNGILATKVAFCNEISQMCTKLGVNYEEVRRLALWDNRIGPSHTQVPGPDGKIGFGGSCFPKDINNLRASAQELGVPEKIFTAVIERNSELRPEKDWEQLKERAVTDR